MAVPKPPASGTYILEAINGKESWETLPPPSSGSSIYYNVVTYGADPTGDTDSTTAIQNAINAAADQGANNGQGGIVYFPSVPNAYQACYKFGTLAVPNIVGLLGDGWYQGGSGFLGDSSYGQYTSGSILKATSLTEPGIWVYGSTAGPGGASPGNRTAGFYLKDLCLLGPGSGTTPGIQIGGGGSFSVWGRVDNVEAANFATCWDLYGVENSTFINWNAEGCEIGVQTQDGTNANVFLTTGVTFADQYAILDNGSLSNKWLGMVLQGCYNATAYLDVTNCSNNSYEQIYLETGTSHGVPPAAAIIHNSGSDNEYRNLVSGDSVNAKISVNGSDFGNLFSNFKSNVGETVITVAGGAYAVIQWMDGAFSSVAGPGAGNCLVMDITHGIVSPAGFFTSIGGSPI